MGDAGLLVDLWLCTGMAHYRPCSTLVRHGDRATRCRDVSSLVVPERALREYGTVAVAVRRQGGESWGLDLSLVLQ